MSGTSADAADAALVRLAGSVRELELLAFHSEPLPDSLRERIHGLVQGPVRVRELAQLDVELGERFAASALAVVQAAGLVPEAISGIGSHGQTVGHFPEPEIRASLQLGSPAVLHERTGIPVVADFRRADLAAGGQGAPLTPFFHHAFFASEAEPRALLNLGGFTNLSYLPDPDPAHVVAFDPGPGNALLDRAARWASGGRERFDSDGARARAGQVHGEVLEELLADPYFAKPPPKSTGHEHFGAAFFERARDGVLGRNGTPEDVLATLTRFTAASVRDQAGRFLPGVPARWILYGGGLRNSLLVSALRAELEPTPIETSDQHGVPARALEAVSFAVLGWAARRGVPGNLPSATGARRAVVLGSATPP